jgi:hypothetical protein
MADELAQRAAEDWIVLRTRELGDGFLDHGKRVNEGIGHCIPPGKGISGAGDTTSRNRDTRKLLHA